MRIMGRTGVTQGALELTTRYLTIDVSKITFCHLAASLFMFGSCSGTVR